MNPIYRPPSTPFDIVPIRVGTTEKRTITRACLRANRICQRVRVYGKGGERKGEREREREREKGGEKCQEFCPRGNLSLRKVYSAIAFFPFFFFFYATGSFRGNNFRNVTIITRATLLYLSKNIYISDSGSNEMDGLISLSIGRGFLSRGAHF